MAAPTPRMHGISHVPGGPDPIPGLDRPPSGDTIDAVIEGLDPAGFWKLNESSGTVAADSSGNGLDLTADTGPPIWGAPAGPPGEQAADFDTGTSSYPPPAGTAARVARTWPTLISGDFTAGIFLSPHGIHSQVFGQGNPDRSSGSGWSMVLSSSYPVLGVRNSGTVTVGITADNPLDLDTWAMIACVHDGTTWRLNVNGLDQASPATGAYTPVTDPLWIGHDAGLGFNAYQPCHCTLSYGFLIPSALSGSELLGIYDSAVLPGGANDGKALLATGLGSTIWDFAIEVTY